MAYGKKYNIPFVSFFGNDYETQIFKNEYSGASTENDGVKPAIIRNLTCKNEDLETPIRAQSVEIGLNSETNFMFTELFTTNDREYLIKIYKDTSQLFWQGYNKPGEYSEPYESPPYDVFIEANDGLGELKNFPFAYDNGDAYSGKKTLMEILCICLNKLDLDITIRECVSYLETNMDDSSSDSCLTQAYYPSENFSDKNCYEVIEAIAKTFYAWAFIRRNAFYIISIENYLDDTTTYRIFDLDGNYSTNVNVSNGIDITGPDQPIADQNWFIDKPPTLSFKPAWGKFVINQDYGLNTAIFPPKLGSQFIEASTKLSVHYDNPLTFIAISGRQISYLSDYIYYKCGQITSDSAKYFNVKFDVGYTNWTTSQIFVYISDGSNKMYLKNDGTWTSTVNACYEKQFDGYGVDFRSETIPISGEVIVKISINNPGLRLAKFKIDLSNSYVKLESIEETYYSNNELTTKLDNDSSYIPDEIETIMGDIPDITNNALIYRNALYWKSGDEYIPTILWKKRGESREDPLNYLVADDIGINHTYPQWMLEGTLRCHFEPGDVIKTESKKFLIIRGSQDIEENEWQVVLLEIGGISDSGFLLRKEGGYIKLKGGGKIKLKTH